MEIVDSIKNKKKKVKFTIVTNGILLSEEKLFILQKII